MAAGGIGKDPERPFPSGQKLRGSRVQGAGSRATGRGAAERTSSEHGPSQGLRVTGGHGKNPGPYGESLPRISPKTVV